MLASALVILSKLRGRRNISPLRTEEGGGVDSAPASRSAESQWFWDHYDGAAQQIADAFNDERISLADRVIADIGCGDGFIDLGVFHKCQPRQLVGFDLNLTNTDYLLSQARKEGVPSSGLDGLVFREAHPTRIPADDHSFDLVFSWSAFEHVMNPVVLLQEIHRILSPSGVFFLQLWPFYMSAKGSHLWEIFPDDHHHLQRPEFEVVKDLESSTLRPPEWRRSMGTEFQNLNRITVDELQRSMLAAGFVVRRVEFMTNAFRVTPELARYSWLDLGIGGIKLIASATV